MLMKRIFPDVIEAYDRHGDFFSSDDPEGDKAYEEYVRLLPTFQEFFQRVSNKKALDAGVKMGIISSSRKPSNKKKIITLRRIMNLFRSVHPRQPDDKDPAPAWMSISYGLYGNNRIGYPTGIWLEYLWNPLDVIAASKLDIEDDDPYQVAIAIAEKYRLTRMEEFLNFQKTQLVAQNETSLS